MRHLAAETFFDVGERLVLLLGLGIRVGLLYFELLQLMAEVGVFLSLRRFG